MNYRSKERLPFPDVRCVKARRDGAAAERRQSGVDSLLVQEVECLAFVAGQLLQGAALLLDGRLDVGGGGVVLDVHRSLRRRRRLLPSSARRAKQAAETGGVRGGPGSGGRGGRSRHTNV